MNEKNQLEKDLVLSSLHLAVLLAIGIGKNELLRPPLRYGWGTSLILRGGKNE